MKKHLVLIFFFPLLLGFALIGRNLSYGESHSLIQRPANNESLSQRRFQKAIKKSGWTIPKAVVDKSNGSKFESVGNVSVAKKKLLVRKNTEFALENFVARSEEEIEIFTRKYEVKNLFSYEIEGKVFAYQAELIPIEIQENRKVYAGAIISIFFVDNEGDGIFEERYSSLEINNIPNWVKS